MMLHPGLSTVCEWLKMVDDVQPRASVVINGDEVWSALFIEIVCLKLGLKTDKHEELTYCV